METLLCMVVILALSGLFLYIILLTHSTDADIESGLQHVRGLMCAVMYRKSTDGEQVHRATNTGDAEVAE